MASLYSVGGGQGYFGKSLHSDILLEPFCKFLVVKSNDRLPALKAVQKRQRNTDCVGNHEVLVGSHKYQRPVLPVLLEVAFVAVITFTAWTILKAFRKMVKHFQFLAWTDFQSIGPLGRCFL